MTDDLSACQQDALVKLAKAAEDYLYGSYESEAIDNDNDRLAVVTRNAHLRRDRYWRFRNALDHRKRCRGTSLSEEQRAEILEGGPE